MHAVESGRPEVYTWGRTALSVWREEVEEGEVARGWGEERRRARRGGEPLPNLSRQSGAAHNSIRQSRYRHCVLNVEVA